MLHTAYAIAAAALIAASFVSFPSLSPKVQAHAPAPGAKSDRADTRPLGMECSQQAWPYFEAACLRDVHNRYGQAREVRFVFADRR